MYRELQAILRLPSRQRAQYLIGPIVTRRFSNRRMAADVADALVPRLVGTQFIAFLDGENRTVMILME
jgi:hypothetical protein